jgi:hypothetical protein
MMSSGWILTVLGYFPPPSEKPDVLKTLFCSPNFSHEQQFALIAMRAMSGVKFGPELHHVHDVLIQRSLSELRTQADTYTTSSSM